MNRSSFLMTALAEKPGGNGPAEEPIPQALPPEFADGLGDPNDDPASFARLLLVSRSSACIVLAFQALYMMADLRWGKARSAAISPLHALNFLTSLTFLRLTFLPNYRNRFPQLIVGGCALIFAGTTALSIITTNRAPLTMSVTISLVALAALIPWNWRWQAALTLAATASMAAFTLLWRERAEELGYSWLALVAAAGAGHYVSLSGQRYRREIADRISALQSKHRELIGESAARAAAAAANERVRQQLSESEAKLRKIFEASSDVITISRLSDGRYLDVNEAFETAFGYTREEAAASSAGAMGLWADQAKLRDFLKKLKTDGAVVNMELDVRTKDGHVEPYLISAKVIELIGEDCVVSISRNIRSIKQAEADLIAARETMRAQIETLERTEARLRAEISAREQAMEQREAAMAANALAIQQLGESEAKLRKIFETSSDHITINRLSDGRYLDVNEAFELDLGYRREEVLGSSAGVLGIWADKAQLREFLKKLRADGAVVNMEVLTRAKDGRIEPYLGSAKVIELGGEECVVATARNIRSIKEAEEDLIAAREAALAASRAKSEFLSSMSHEIRTPMNALLGMAQVLRETSLNPDQRKYLEIMMHNGDALLDLINSILDLAKIESGRMALEQAGFDLETAVDRTLETLSVRAYQKGIELMARVMPGVPTQLVGDRLRLGQILLNLLGNAVKFTDKGQVLLTVECDSATADAGHLHFAVADTGIGIAEDHLESVFADFTQADSSTSRQYGGSGLGLAIVRRLAALMGGRAWVESKLGQGSVFHFTVQFQIKTDAPKIRPAMSLSGIRTLVVDDNSSSRLILSEMLGVYGAQVDETDTGIAALELIEGAAARALPYRLVLLDSRMAGMDGFEVAKRLKSSSEQPATVLMLTPDDFTVQLGRAKELGIEACLVKPVRRGDLLDVIGTALAGHARSAGRVNEARQPAALVTAGSAQATQPDLPLNILLADDSPDNRVLIHAYLKHTGCRLDDAENGAVAVAKLKAGNYDLVLMDMQMPVMDGIEATRAIRAWERERGLPRTPLLALTASALGEDVRRTLGAGADMHVSKPIKKAALIAAIHQIYSLAA